MQEKPRRKRAVVSRFTEIAFARSLGNALLPMKIGDCAIPAAFTDVQSVDLCADPEVGYRRLWAGLRQTGLDSAPYPGLMVFQEQDAPRRHGSRGGRVLQPVRADAQRLEARPSRVS